MSEPTLAELRAQLEQLIVAEESDEVIRRTCDNLASQLEAYLPRQEQ